jgi:very-short-patch-repair endonuclease
VRSQTITLKRARRMRRALTPPELALWSQLKSGGLGLHFRRQHPAGPYILDFYCAEAQLAVEIDGQAHGHDLQAAHDERRGAWLGSQGIGVLRIPARYVKGDLSPVLAMIRDAAARRIAATDGVT